MEIIRTMLEMRDQNQLERGNIVFTSRFHGWHINHL